MFERFTERARQVVVLAQDEARALGHGYIGTEHVLLGLVREGEGVAAQILWAFGADAETVHATVIRALGGAGGFVTALAGRPWPAAENLPRPRGRRHPWFLSPVEMLVAGWLLFAFALGAGILVGWAIWG